MKILHTAALLALIVSAPVLAQPVAAPAAPAQIAPATPAQKAPAQTAGFERQAIGMMLMNCLAPLSNNQDVAAFAVERKLTEYPAASAKLFAPNGGRVFALPAQGGNAVMVALPTGGCQLMMQQVNAQAFWSSVEEFLGATSPFKLVSENKAAAETQRQYRGDVKGPVALFASARNQYVANQVQALITISRVR